MGTDRALRSPAAPPSALADIDWGQVYVEAKHVARKFAPEQELDDIVTEGITRTLDGTAPWDPSGGMPLAAHVVHAGRAGLRNQIRKQQRRTSGAFVAAMTHEIESRPAPTPEELSVEADLHDRKARLMRQLEGELAGDPDALALVECARKGIEGAADQVFAADLDAAAVQSARKRIKRKVEALWRAWRGEVGDE